jgi:hypothetical protein
MVFELVVASFYSFGFFAYTNLLIEIRWFIFIF